MFPNTVKKDMMNDMKERIESLQNAKIKKWASLHQKKNRDALGLFLVEGEHLISEAMKVGCVEAILYDEECPFAHERSYYVTPAIMKKLSENISPVHLIAVCRKKENKVGETERLLLLDGVQDPGNLGTLVRSAVSFGFDAVYCSKNTCDIYNQKTIRSTQGALFHIPVIYENLSDLIRVLKNEDFRIFGTALENGKPLARFQPEEKMAFILGNEGQGVSQDLLALADENIFIEMHSFDSLNVAVAGGILMYTFRR